MIAQARINIGDRSFATHSIIPIHRGMSPDEFNRRWPSGFKYTARKLEAPERDWILRFRADESWIVAEHSPDEELCEVLLALEVWEELTATKKEIETCPS